MTKMAQDRGERDLSLWRNGVTALPPGHRRREKLLLLTDSGGLLKLLAVLWRPFVEPVMAESSAAPVHTSRHKNVGVTEDAFHEGVLRTVTEWALLSSSRFILHLPLKSR